MENSDKNHKWLALYREAVLEPDRDKVKVRIAQAQIAIRRRALELWYAGTSETGERHRMDAASHLLGLLHTIAADK